MQCIVTRCAGRQHQVSWLLQELQWLAEESKEYCLAVRYGRVYAERLMHSPQARPRPASLGSSCRPFTTIVSGGAKGLGSEATRDAIKNGCQCIVATSRRPKLSKDELIAWWKTSQHVPCSW